MAPQKQSMPVDHNAGVADSSSLVEVPRRIVGIGASAGGLEAFEQFFQHMPAESGLAFVLVPHLDPDHASILGEILQRCTAMPVLEAQDQAAVLPNHVYIIPPKRDMGILNGALQLTASSLPRGQRKPINTFLGALATDQGAQAIGIILSGSGDDGARGLRAVLDAGGNALIQEPSSAKYDGMPRSAIAGAATATVLQVEQMPEALLAATRGPCLQTGGPPAAPVPSAKGASGRNRILQQLRAATGHDFSLYKKSTLSRRIERRMALHSIDSTELYARYLKENPAEIQTLFKELLINVTRFFRDPDAFVALRQHVLPQLLAGKPEGYVFRVWVAACASGEEAYSIAILLRELLDENEHNFKVQLFATDLDSDAIDQARAGHYPFGIAEDLTPERLRRWFVKEDTGYRIKKEIREMVVFAIQNMVKDPPFTKLDVLSCRNLLIYLEPELQDRLISVFHYALKPNGLLLLSPSESIGKHADLFAAADRKWKFYHAVHFTPASRPRPSGALPWDLMGRKTPDAIMPLPDAINFAELTRRALLQSYAPASVVIDREGNILYVHGETGKYLRPAPGEATLNIVEMAREELQLALRAALSTATSDSMPVAGQTVLVKTSSGTQPVSLSVRPLSDPKAKRPLYLISFQDTAPAAETKAPGGKHAGGAGKKRSVAELESDLAYTRENLQATIEAQQASNEALQSTNEELQSTNEELQSTNEELETSKEELQSVNEELVTVNAELQAKIEQLASMQNDMKNLLDNFTVGTVFLDERMVIRRFTREAVQVYRLVASDVGRPLADIKPNLENEDLLGEAQRVLDTLEPCEREVRTLDGAWYLVRIQPYRTLENAILGVVLAFTNISQRVQAEAKVRAAQQLAESIIDTMHETLLVLDADMRVRAASRSFYSCFQTTADDTLGQPIFALCQGAWDIPALHDFLGKALVGPQGDLTVEQDFPLIGRRRWRLNARSIVGETAQRALILVASDAGRDPQLL